ncbi:MAG: hypothetical protein LBI69_01505 [Puniceicoccales bacterium]|jgi:hypothetical protein|nr:hypothetical protein [Puniceicoccales bacterium]
MDQRQQSSQLKPKRQTPLKPIDPEKFSLDIGLEKITTNRNQQRVPRLPERGEIGPSDGRIEERLQEIIDLKTFESILIDALRPNIKNRQLLLPVHFRRCLISLCDSLRKLSAEKNGEETEEIKALLSLLETHLREETGRNELLEQYRLMILMG